MIQQIWQHVQVMNREMGVIQAQVEMLCKFFWILMTASIGATIAAVWSLILHKKNNKG